MHEPYVTDPVEPAPQPRLARLRPVVGTVAVVILLLASATLYLQGRGEEDPALEVPATATEAP